MEHIIESDSAWCETGNIQLLLSNRSMLPLPKNGVNKTIQNMKVGHPSFKIVTAGDFNATIGSNCDPDR